MALIHDDDLTTIGGGFTTQPEELMTLLRSSLPTIQEFECGTLYDDKCGSRADVETIKVATLSKHIFQNPEGGTSPPRRTFSNRSYNFDISVPIPVDISAPQAVDSPSSDPIRDLNNFLQEVRGHNLVPFLQFTNVQSGQNTQAIYTGTYFFRGIAVGKGTGVAIRAAKRLAAMQALQYFHTYGIPE